MHMGEVITEPVNDTTRKLAPQGPVHETGQVTILPHLFRSSPSLIFTGSLPDTDNTRWIRPNPPYAHCAICHTSIEETEIHLYQCPIRLPLVGNLFNKLQKFHEWEYTCPALQDTLFTALQYEIFGHYPDSSTTMTMWRCTNSAKQNKRCLVGANCSEAGFCVAGPKCNTRSS